MTVSSLAAVASASLSLLLAGLGAAAVPSDEGIETGRGMRGTLVAIPSTVSQGERIGAATYNRGETTMVVGLGFHLEQRVANGWSRISIPESFMTGPGVLDGAGPPRLRPGERIGPHFFGPVYDRYRLRPEIQPGEYRLVKGVKRQGSSQRLRLVSRFTVRGAPSFD